MGFIFVFVVFIMVIGMVIDDGVVVLVGVLLLLFGFIFGFECFVVVLSWWLNYLVYELSIKFDDGRFIVWYCSLLIKVWVVGFNVLLFLKDR